MIDRDQLIEQMHTSILGKGLRDIEIADLRRQINKKKAEKFILDMHITAYQEAIKDLTPVRRTTFDGCPHVDSRDYPEGDVICHNPLRPEYNKRCNQRPYQLDEGRPCNY